MKRRLSYFLIGLLLALLVVPAQALPPAEPPAETIAVAEAAAPITTPYEFPVRGGTDEWLKFGSLAEKTAALQVPADILERMTTDALLETVWNYPLLSNALFFTTMEQGIRSVFSYANCLQELARRPDREVVLARFYQQLTLNTQSDEEPLDTKEAAELVMPISFQLAIAEAILFNPTFTSFTMADRDTILATDYSAGSGTSAIEITPMAGEDRTNGTVYTPNGSSVAVLINRNPELTSTDISYLNTFVSVNYCTQ